MHKGVNVLGVLISPIRMGDALRAIEQWVIERRGTYITVTPAHAVMEVKDESEHIQEESAAQDTCLGIT